MPRKQHLGFAPKLSPEKFKCAFTSAEGWGSYAQEAEGARWKANLAVHWGQLTLKTLALASMEGNSIRVSRAEKSGCELHAREQTTLIMLAVPVKLAAGATLEISVA